MEKLSGHGQGEDPLDMPPGFRFHPTDEELITHYLSNKVVDNNFFAKAIGEVDMNKTEPWDLPMLAKLGGKEWYFFCVRDKKYPTGLRTNRATAAGYWKATGKDKEIFRGRLLIGMKKTLVFYTGRAPKGEKTNWVIHEYRLEGKFSLSNLPKSAKNEWVICRLFHKTNSSNSVATSLPPLMETPAPFSGKIINRNIPDSIHVPCFSNTIQIQTTQKNMISNFLNNPIFEFESNSSLLRDLQSDPFTHQFRSGCSFPMGDQPILMGSQETGESSEKNTKIPSNLGKRIKGIEDQEAPSTSGGPIDLDCLWNY
ncbi:hypothetical protein SSX86_013883 [Deinandra increscens subsp. villosa]|uniref:NAC domain-containing protein n=1 Tax=Deinandra increscens subsp. villosa TaxID=3103831 RepID=A0AAP0D5I1_9ASTR